MAARMYDLSFGLAGLSGEQDWSNCTPLHS